MRFDFATIGPWAAQVAMEQGAESRLGRLALQTAMRFNAEGAAAAWARAFHGADDLVLRTRLALIALAVSPWVQPTLYAPMVQTQDPLIQQLGQTGQAVAKRQDVGPAVVALIELQHPIANDWALSYAKQYASEADAIPILMGLIVSYEKAGQARGKVGRLDDAVQAAQALVERNVNEAAARLRPMLAAPDTDPVLAQGILLGLIRSDAPQPHLVVLGLKPMDNANANRLALFLVARHTLKVEPAQMDDLALIVRGGGGMSDTLRLQAAWTYLKITHRAQATLNQVLQG